jgi:hypothetical protein
MLSRRQRAICLVLGLCSLGLTATAVSFRAHPLEIHVQA